MYLVSHSVVLNRRDCFPLQIAYALHTAASHFKALDFLALKHSHWEHRQI